MTTDEAYEKIDTIIFKHIVDSHVWNPFDMKYAIKGVLKFYAEQVAKRAYPDKEADGVVFCGKCGTAIE